MLICEGFYLTIVNFFFFFMIKFHLLEINLIVLLRPVTYHTIMSSFKSLISVCSVNETKCKNTTSRIRCHQDVMIILLLKYKKENGFN